MLNIVEKLFHTHFGTGNRLQQSGNRLPESKDSLVKAFVKTSCATHCFEKLFSTSLD